MGGGQQQLSFPTYRGLRGRGVAKGGGETGEGAGGVVGVFAPERKEALEACELLCAFCAGCQSGAEERGEHIFNGVGEGGGRGVEFGVVQHVVDKV